MFFKAIKLCVNNMNSDSYAVVSENPVFSWSIEHEDKSAVQKGYIIKVYANDEMIWDSGLVLSDKCEAEYNGIMVEYGVQVRWELQILDNSDRISETVYGVFKFVPAELTGIKWITKKGSPESQPIYFAKQFECEKEIKNAVLFVCGLGYQRVIINGMEADDAVLQPMFVNYSKKCYYVTLDVKKLLLQGKNCIGIKIGDGWRRNHGRYIRNMPQHPIVRFFGFPQLAAKLVISYSDGTTTEIVTDESWYAFEGGSVRSHLFEGEIYDATKEPEGWDTARFDYSGYNFADISKQPLKLVPQYAEPIKIQKKLKAVLKTMIEPGVYIFDFGENIAGFAQIKIPSGMKKGDKITMQFSEETNNNGELEMNMMGDAVSIDEYISNGEDAGKTWNPEFLYHGFRYMKLTGWPGIPDEDSITALMVYSNVDNKSFFECGSAIVNKIYDNVVRTERDNLHGIATDCPQRHERMGWMNDATVRFEEIAYNFNVSRLFPKIIQDIALEQNKQGEITCTAPFIAGNQPADPVCSAFLVAGIQTWLHYGNKQVIKEHYQHFKAWNRRIKKMRNKDDGLIYYSFYGDWAGTADSCVSMENPHSAITPCELMSLGYHYYNYKTLAKMAEILGYEEEKNLNEQEAEEVRETFLNTWWDEKTGTVATGSQGCQAFALWLGILPEEGRKKAAAKLYETVESIGFRLKAGNLTSRYIMDVLADYGYIDAAWKIITREEYPSFGYMIQNEATTIWERFEQKNNSNMNSHNHPMYGAVGSWFYSHIAGLRPIDNGWEKFLVKPCIPKDLMYAKARIDTLRGDINIKWFKRFGKLNVHIQVPYGSVAYYDINSDRKELTSGFYKFSYDIDE